jgi:hypothetical protein
VTGILGAAEGGGGSRTDAANPRCPPQCRVRFGDADKRPAFATVAKPRPARNRNRHETAAVVRSRGGQTFRTMAKSTDYAVKMQAPHYSGGVYKIANTR